MPWPSPPCTRHFDNILLRCIITQVAGTSPLSDVSGIGEDAGA